MIRRNASSCAQAQKINPCKQETGGPGLEAVIISKNLKLTTQAHVEQLVVVLQVSNIYKVTWRRKLTLPLLPQ